MNGIRLSTKKHRILEAEAFDTFLRMETRRAIRSRKSLVLLLLDIPSTRDVSSGRDSASLDDVSPVLDRLSSSVRATDYIGWRESGKRLGILFTEVASDRGEDIAKLLSAKVARLLSQPFPSSSVANRLNARFAEQPIATLLPSGRSYVFVDTGTT